MSCARGERSLVSAFVPYMRSCRRAGRVRAWPRVLWMVYPSRTCGTLSVYETATVDEAGACRSREMNLPDLNKGVGARLEKAKLRLASACSAPTRARRLDHLRERYTGVRDEEATPARPRPDTGQGVRTHSDARGASGPSGIDPFGGCDLVRGRRGAGDRAASPDAPTPDWRTMRRFTYGWER